MKFPIKKGWLILIAIFLAFVILNPSYTTFRQFIGDNDGRKTYNFLVCSVYEYGTAKYLGVLMNFVEIKERPSISKIIEGCDSTITSPVVYAIESGDTAQVKPTKKPFKKDPFAYDPSYNKTVRHH